MDPLTPYPNYPISEISEPNRYPKRSCLIPIEKEFIKGGKEKDVSLTDIWWCIGEKNATKTIILACGKWKV